MRSDSKMVRFLTVLADAGETMPTHVIARRSGLTMRDCGRISSRLVERDRVSRIKPKLSDGGGYYRYFLTDAQLDAYYRVAGVNPYFGIAGVDAIGLMDRLRFLRMLGERSAYKGNPALAAIMADYKRALRVARDREEAN